MDLYRLLCTFVLGVLLAMAMLLTFMRLPASAEWRRIRRARDFTALACIVLGFAYGSSILMGWTNSVPVLLVWFVVASLQAILFTFTCVIFVAPLAPVRRLIYYNLIPIVVMTTLTSFAYFVHSRVAVGLLVASVVCYLVQLGLYTYYFLKIYRENVAHLEEVYDDDLSLRLLWVKSLFFSALSVGLMAAVVVLAKNQTLDAIFGILVAGYYIYVCVSFVNYIARAAFVIKAWTPKQSVMESELKVPLLERTDEVRGAVDKWVNDKSYLLSDISMDEVALQMGVSRIALNNYFSNTLKTRFRTWRMELRIGEAIRLITEHPELPTTELYLQCGYNDRSNFYKHFQRVTGKTIAEYKGE